MTRQQEYEARLLLQTRQIRICRIMILILFLSLWELTASLGLINRFIFSSPSQILFCLWNMLLDKSLFLHTGVTLTETLLSFLLCTLISLLTALFLWSSPFAAQIFEPFLVLLNSLPKSALAPLLLVWLGNRMRTVIVAAVSIAVFGSVMTLYTGFNQMDPDKIRLIYALGGAKKEVLTKVLLPVRNLLTENGEIVCLIKPQFEAGRGKVGKKGVVRERSTHVEVLENAVGYAAENGFSVAGLDFSPVKGPEGNIEYLMYLRREEGGSLPEREEIAALVERSHAALD